MRPLKMTEAHQTGNLAELVCSNSLRNASMETAVGVLKQEMRRLGSLVMLAADRARVPAGAALAVDREDFSGFITATLQSHPLVEIVREEVAAIPDGPAIIASGPLTARFPVSSRWSTGRASTPLPRELDIGGRHGRLRVGDHAEGAGDS